MYELDLKVWTHKVDVVELSRIRVIGDCQEIRLLKVSELLVALIVRVGRHRRESRVGGQKKINLVKFMSANPRAKPTEIQIQGLPSKAQ